MDGWARRGQTLKIHPHSLCPVIMEAATCASCGMNSLLAQNFVIFPCPNCGKATVARCGRCKALGRNYECGECGFEGP